MQPCDSLVTQMVKNPPAMRETLVWSLGQEDPLEKEMATQSSTLTWKISWMEEPGGLQSMELQRVGNNWATSLSLWTFFDIVFLWDWNENWPFPVLWPLLSFPNLLAYWVQHFHSIIFQIKRLQFRMNIWFWDKMNEWAWAKQSNRSRRDTNRGLFSLICSPSSRGGRHEKETHLLAQRYMDNVLDV